MGVRSLCFLTAGSLLLTIICGGVAGVAAENPNTLVVAHMEYAWTFDPMYNWWDVNRLTRVTYDALTNYDPVAKTVVPWVAKAWDISQDGLTYTFYLNEGIKFHDGTDLTAADVKFTVDRLKALQDGIAQYFECVKSVEILDDYTVRFTLKEPNSGFLPSTVLLYIISEDGVKAHEQNGDWAAGYLQNYDLGSGPYQVVLNVPEQRTVCEKFPDYWKGWEGKHIDKITWLWIKDPSIQRMMLVSGQLDIAMNPSVADLPYFEADPNLEVVSSLSAHILAVSFRTIHKPLGDVRVRRALAMAIDYDYLIQVASGGYGKRAVSPVASVLPGYDDKLTPMPYDMETAKQVLAEAGYPNGGFTLTIAYQSEHPAYRRLVEVLRDNWGALGIATKLMSMDWNAQTAMEGDPNSEPDIYIDEPGPDTMDLVQYFNQYYGSEYLSYGSNAAWFSDPEVDELIHQAQAESNPERYIELCREIQRKIVAAVPQAWIYEVPYVIAVQKYVKGFVYNPAFHDTLDVYHMWLDSKP